MSEILKKDKLPEKAQEKFKQGAELLKDIMCSESALKAAFPCTEVNQVDHDEISEKT